MRLIDADSAINDLCGSSCGCRIEDCGLEEPCEKARCILRQPPSKPNLLGKGGDKMGIDKAIHLAFNGCLKIAKEPNCRNETDLLCEHCGNKLTIAYHESELYSLHCWRCRIVILGESKEPARAIDKLRDGV